MTDDEKALALFQKFHHRPPHGNELATLSFPAPFPVLQVGRAWAISYTVKDEAKPYFHQFDAGNRPFLYVSSDGKLAFIVKGRWKFTERGFVG